MTTQKNSTEWREELKVHLGTRQELGGGMEDEVVESFLKKVQGAIDDQVDARVREALGARKRSSGIATWRVTAALCCSIPLLAIAGALGGTWGILAVIALILVVIFKA